VVSTYRGPFGKYLWADYFGTFAALATVLFVSIAGVRGNVALAVGAAVFFITFVAVYRHLGKGLRRPRPEHFVASALGTEQALDQQGAEHKQPGRRGKP